MELTTGQQRLLFVFVVLALAGLGFYLIGGRGSGGTPAAAPSTSATDSPTPTATGAAAATSVPPATVPAATPVSTAGGAEIYQWLPFTPDDLAAAAKSTQEFVTAYTTW